MIYLFTVASLTVEEDNFTQCILDHRRKPTSKTYHTVKIEGLTIVALRDRYLFSMVKHIKPCIRCEYDLGIQSAKCIQRVTQTPDRGLR